MAEKLTSDVEAVSKLKRRLHDAAHQQKQVRSIKKTAVLWSQSSYKNLWLAKLMNIFLFICRQWLC
jgi:hypothetical protein